jgi:diketogulonate reductase-like aldo/keto reductase
MPTEPTNHSRRAATQSALALAAASLAGLPAAAQQSAAAQQPTPGRAGQPPPNDSARLTRPIPASGERLPAIGLGTYQSFDITGDTAELAKARDVLTAFAAAGGGMIDSSPMYGAAEAVVGELAAALAVQGKLFTATKVWTSGKARGIAQMEESFTKMRVKQMDLMQVHNLQDTATHLETLAAWRREKRVRFLGVTHYHAGAYGELEAAIKRHKPDFVQFNYSLAERDAEARLLGVADGAGVAVIINRPFAQGGLFGKVRGKTVPDWAREFAGESWAQFFLKYIIAHPAVTVAIPATRNAKHLADNLGAMRGRLPTAAERAKMVEWVRSL